MDRIVLMGAVGVGIYVVLSGHFDGILGIPGKVLDDVEGVVDTVTHDVSKLFDIPGDILGNVPGF